MGKYRSTKQCTIEGCESLQDSHTFCPKHANRLRKNGSPYISLKGMNTKERNGQWKGEDVGYAGIHEWIRNRLIKPLACQDCGEVKPLDLANISQEYKRELSDWEWLCRKCHMTKDGRINRLRFTGRTHTPESADRIRHIQNLRRDTEFKSAQDERIITAHHRRIPIRAIARQEGLSRTTVYNILNNAPILLMEEVTSSARFEE